jgi:hypothetical protein
MLLGVFKTIFFGSVVVSILLFANKCYMIWDVIFQACFPLYQMIPGMPHFFYFITNSLLHGIILPLTDLAEAANGNKLMFLWSLIPSERDLIVLSINIFEVGDKVLKDICAYS